MIKKDNHIHSKPNNKEYYLIKIIIFIQNVTTLVTTLG